MPTEVAVIGSSNVDLLMKADTLPEKGETVTGASFMQVFGGKGANQAVASARAGARTLFVNAVGQDPYVETMLGSFKAEGIDCSCILQFDDVASGHALCMTGQGGANYLMVASGANMKLGPEQVRPFLPVLAEIPVWLLQCEIPPDTNTLLLEAARNLPNQVIWNYAPALQADNPPVELCDVLVVNEIEATQLSSVSVYDRASAVRAAEALQQKGIPHLIVTLGGNGLVYLGPEGEKWIPSHRVDVVDTVAAGDTFCGALACSLSRKTSWEKSLAYANAAAALSVTRLGAQPSIPRENEIIAFLETADSV